ncbi:sensor histidine kinase [Actinomycetes bacterium M1A6_2h]
MTSLFRTMRNYRGWRPEHVAVLPLLTLAASLLFLAALYLTGIADESGRRLLQSWGALAFAAALAVMAAAACLRRRYPIVAYLAAVAVTGCLVVSIGDLGFTPLYWVAIVCLAVRVSGAALVACASVGVAGDALASSVNASSWVVPALNILISYSVLLLLGKVIAHNRSQARLSETALATARAEHEARLEEAIESERRTMARELHDVAAHHLTGMIIQARSADKVIGGDPDRAQELLRDVIDSGQRTLDGLRQIVGILRYSSDEHAPPQPVIGDIAGLAEASRHALRTVDVEIDDDIENVDSAVQLACYRITQESLANAMRHSPGSDASVRLFRRNGSVHLTVEDTGHDGPAAAGDGQGLGIAGMRERAMLLGGRLDAGPGAGGGWHVTAELPVDGRIAP